MFSIRPLITSAHFLQRREVVLEYLVVITGFGVALAGWVTPDARLIRWSSIVVIGAVLTGLLVALKERMLLDLSGAAARRSLGPSDGGRGPWAVLASVGPEDRR